MTFDDANIANIISLFNAATIEKKYYDQQQVNMRRNVRYRVSSNFVYMIDLHCRNHQWSVAILLILRPPIRHLRGIIGDGDKKNEIE